MPTPSQTQSSAHASVLLRTRLSDLDCGARLFLWAFRSCALGCQPSACLPPIFDHYFGAAGPDILRHILVMAQGLGQFGQRKIHLNLPRSDRLSRDEASLLKALSAAQLGREAGLTAQLHWLAAGAPIATVAQASCIVAGGFTAAGLVLPRLDLAA